jgi:hypothetical protein
VIEIDYKYNRLGLKFPCCHYDKQKAIEIGSTHLIKATEIGSPHPIKVIEIGLPHLGASPYEGDWGDRNGVAPSNWGDWNSIAPSNWGDQNLVAPFNYVTLQRQLRWLKWGRPILAM